MRSHASRFAMICCCFTTLTTWMACGGSDNPGDPMIDCPAVGRYMPMQTGNIWTYDVTDVQANTLSSKTQTVGALEDMDGDKLGIQAFRVTTEKDTGMVVSWQEDTGDAILRHREVDMAGSTQTVELYNPYKARLDERAEHLLVGATWTDDYTEVVTDATTGAITTQPKSEDWEIEMIDDMVTVPAGTFCALRVRRISTANTSGSDKVYWFARGVGKVKEYGIDRIEELAGYQVVP